ncbi:hypothetical protein [Ligilactobacillus equi]|uniref:Uncharacterized protein n=2 Tax=Ligilactobacillus equi TaxID=137357 RepID=V7HW67_9LACO|nr:hypothetical protein [Ligilactobacillus equi]ETA74484.1 hypothetical protein LEQ_0349 [Ligilactobacillus equi DPC 6820]KRL78108.1 hypothetical protein FC36_GL001158 [Ligilactobacillus equi DSM 15833 = JCM 10991]
MSKKYTDSKSNLFYTLSTIFLTVITVATTILFIIVPKLLIIVPFIIAYFLYAGEHTATDEELFGPKNKEN